MSGAPWECPAGVDKCSERCYTIVNRIGLIVGEEEGEAMKKHWLRGLLLGVSLALLLSGGVALAQSGSIEPYCYWCCDKCEEEWGCDGWILSSSGWDANEWLDLTLTSPGPGGTLSLLDRVPADADGDVLFDVYIMCPECVEAFKVQGVPPDYVAIGGNWQPGDYGEWTLELEGAAGKVMGKFYFAEDPSDCQVEEEFVPEPGSMLLLGSGLAGLAGYAALRWRTKE
jgi:hypothetical protein